MLNGRTLDPADGERRRRIRLDDLEAENELSVVATRAYTNTGEGLHRFVDPVDDGVYLYTQFEVAEPNRVYAVFDQPDLKATVRFPMTAPADWQVLSNAPTPEPVPAPVEGMRDLGVRDRPVISSYIVAIIAGPYARWHGTARSSRRPRHPARPLHARLARPVRRARRHVRNRCRPGSEFYEQAFGVPYPFGKYDQIFVPEYNWGAMENVGAVHLQRDLPVPLRGSRMRGASSARSSCCTSSATCGSATR